jgi:hypothetical protein
MILLGFLIVFTKGTVIAPFIYTIFWYEHFRNICFLSW